MQECKNMFLSLKYQYFYSLYRYYTSIVCPSLLKFVAGKYGLYALLNRAFGVFLDNRVFL
jgi:hypothetical protein